MENMECETTERDEMRDEVERGIAELEIKEEIDFNEQIELLYHVLKEEDQINEDTANRDAETNNKKRKVEYYEPYCLDCLQEPCVWLSNRCAMKKFDRENEQRKATFNRLDDGGKSRRYSLYKKMAAIQWGRHVHRRRHPLCVEDGVRNIAPDPNEIYTGFRASS